MARGETLPAIGGTIAFIMLQRGKNQPIILRNPTEELCPQSDQGG